MTLHHAVQSKDNTNIIIYSYTLVENLTDNTNIIIYSYTLVENLTDDAFA